MNLHLIHPASLREGVAAPYAMIQRLRLEYPAHCLCRALRVSASGYYPWVSRPLSGREQEEARMDLEIRAAHRRTRETYGALRLHHELVSHGIHGGICRIRRIRRKLGIRCKQKRRFRRTTDSRHSLPVAENLLDRQFREHRPNAAWVSDISYVPTDEGWLYLAGHKDLFTGEIVGYAMGERLTRNLAIQFLLRAIEARRPPPGPGPPL